MGKLTQAREALIRAEKAISEYYRYQTGGETRGSYDGKPERKELWASMYQCRAALAALSDGEAVEPVADGIPRYSSRHFKGEQNDD